jgi:low affinity Fe/Cu permease
MKPSENININWAKVAQAIMIFIIVLTTIASSVFLLIFSKGLLSSAYSSTIIMMITATCVIGVISVLLLKNITETNVDTDIKQTSSKSDTIIIDHTKRTSQSSSTPKLNIPKDR